MSDSRGDPSFFRRAPSPVRLSVVSQRSETGLNASLSLVNNSFWLVRIQEPELSRAWAVITKQENWQIQWEFHREWVGETGVKKDVTMRESRDKCSDGILDIFAKF